MSMATNKEQALLEDPTTLLISGVPPAGLLPNAGQLAQALDDIRRGLAQWRLWTALGLYEIRLRYRRTSLGPFWMTFNLGLTISLAGLVFGVLFKVRAETYLPHLASGLVMWFAITATLGEASRCYVDAGHCIKQIKRPLSVYILVVVWRNFIVFLHNLLIVPVVLLVFLIPPGWPMAVAPLMILLSFLTLLPYGLIIAVAGARFRDIPQVVANILASLFFISPIVWKIELLGEHAPFAYINPFTHMLEIVRLPLLGQWMPAMSVLVVIGLAILGWLMAILVFARFRARLAYWV